MHPCKSVLAGLVFSGVVCLGQSSSKTPVAETPEPALSADRVVVRDGATSRSHVWTDGIRWKELSDDGKTGNYTDQNKVYWSWNSTDGCKQWPPPTEHDAQQTAKEEVVGQETIDGHPTKKFKVTVTWPGSSTPFVRYVWRASDLQNQIIRTRSEDGKAETNLLHIVLGKPDPKLLAFPSPPCKHDETADTSRNTPQPAGGFRTIPFFDAGCKKIVPLPVTLAIPSDYAIRDGGGAGCFWGATMDLDRVLASKAEADYTSIQRGVFRCALSLSTEFDPIHKRFVSESDGPQDNWAASMRAMGASGVTITPRVVAGIDTLRVTAILGGQRVYMLYLGFGDSPAILITYRPVGKGGAADDAEWRRFLDSWQAAKKEPAAK